MESVHRSVTKPPLYRHADDLSTQLDWTPLQSMKDLIQHELDLGLVVHGPVMPGDEAVWPFEHRCPHCVFSSVHLPVLRRHLTVEHGIT